MLGRFHRGRAVPAVLGPGCSGTVIRFGALQRLAFVALGFPILSGFILFGVDGLVARLLQTDPAGRALPGTTGRSRTSRRPAGARSAG